MENHVDYGDLKRSREYFDYIFSDEWKTKCNQRYKIDGGVCQCCGSRGTQENPLQCHHLHYGNFKNENVYKDLITLCKSCHEAQHNILRRITDENGGRMWDKNGNVPKVHVFTVSGIDRIRIEEPRKTESGEHGETKEE